LYCVPYCNEQSQLTTAATVVDPARLNDMDGMAAEEEKYNCYMYLQCWQQQQPCSVHKPYQLQGINYKLTY
jgi:hypothetical protein